MSRTLHPYGPQRAQAAEIWRPEKNRGLLPVVILMHGGFWQQIYTRRLMHRLAHAVVAQGWMAYNIEYRRLGLLGDGGWPSTFDDVAMAVEAVANLEGVDLDRVVTCGHSAGGHLALWAAGPRTTPTQPVTTQNRVRVNTAISLAGVVDLVSAARAGIGGGAVAALMGGTPDQVPDRYVMGSPAAQLPLGVPQVLIHGTEDEYVPASLSAAYVDRAVDLGDEAVFIPISGAGHMEMIDPNSPAWTEVAGRLAKVIAGQQL